MGSRPLPPVVLVTNSSNPDYAEVADVPPFDQMNYMREECTGEKKMAAKSETGGNGNSQLYHTLEPVTLDDEECHEEPSDYMEPISSNKMAENCSEPETAPETT